MSAKEKLSIQPGEIHIWDAFLEREQNNLKNAEKSLSNREKSKLDRFIFNQDRKRYMLRHFFLRVLISKYINCAASEVKIVSNKMGKPYIVGLSEENALHFSMSHSAGVAVFAFGKSSELGIDIELIRKFSDMREFALNCFAPPEIQELESCSESKKLISFYKFWARKEAVLKACGEGLTIPLNKVDVSTADKGIEMWGVCGIKDIASERTIRFADVMAEKDFAIAVATDSRYCNISLVFKHFEDDMLC